MALFGEAHERIAGVLDWAELLPQHLAADDDRSEEFEHVLDALVELDPKLRIAIEAFSDAEPVRK